MFQVSMQTSQCEIQISESSNEKKNVLELHELVLY